LIKAEILNPFVTLLHWTNAKKLRIVGVSREIFRSLKAAKAVKSYLAALPFLAPHCRAAPSLAPVYQL
jgi:hypothetical protein